MPFLARSLHSWVSHDNDEATFYHIRSEGQAKSLNIDLLQIWLELRWVNKKWTPARTLAEETGCWRLCAGVEANLKGSNVERKLNKNKKYIVGLGPFCSFPLFSWSKWSWRIYFLTKLSRWKFVLPQSLGFFSGKYCDFLVQFWHFDEWLVHRGFQYGLLADWKLVLDFMGI